MSLELAEDRVQRARRVCDDIGRDFSEIDSSVNLGFYMNSDREPDIAAEGSLTGGPQEAVDMIGDFRDVGFKGINIAFRAPMDWDALQQYIKEVMPGFR